MDRAEENLNENILVTGASGNVGRSVIDELLSSDAPVAVRAAVTPGSSRTFPDGVEPVAFDFLDPATCPAAFNGVDSLFLLRLPALSDVKQEILPTVDFALDHDVGEIVFL